MPGPKPPGAAPVAYLAEAGYSVDLNPSRPTVVPFPNPNRPDRRSPRPMPASSRPRSRPSRAASWVLLAGIAVAAGCGDSGPPPPQPTSINVFPAQAAFDALGDSRNFSANVRDQNGIAMDDQPVTWSSSNSSVVSVDGNGRAAAVGNGSAVVRAMAGEAVGEASVTVNQVATELRKEAGDDQEGPAGTALPALLAVQVRDRLGGPVEGQTIAFSIVGGGGSLSPETVVTDGQGRASSTWTLGGQAGQPQSARAAIQGSGVPGVAFSALGFPGPADELRDLGGGGQAGLVGTALPAPLKVGVFDAFQNPLAAEVTFEVVSGGGSVSPGVVTAGLLGQASTVWTLGPVVGEQRVRARSGGLVSEFAATAAAVAGPPVAVTVGTGNAQEGPAGSPLADALTVVVRDAQGIGVAGALVTFTPSEGSVEPAEATTNASGVAATTWTLGPTVGSQTLEATVAGLSSVTFLADARDPGPTCVLGTPDNAGFDITLCFVTDVSETVEAAFVAARERWESLITGDLSDLPPNPDAPTTCFSNRTAPEMQGALIDDVVIYAVVEEIDGEFNVLGSAGPCYIRQSNALTSVGTMRFDVADLDRLATNGQLEDVILHEMGHVLGLGTLWGTKGFLQNAATDGQQAPGPDTHFNGPLAIAAFNDAGGSNRTAGQKVPVQNVGNSGSINGHWRETTMDRELMTPFLDGGVANPLSIITVQSMADLGYDVSNTDADAYTVASVNGVSGVGDDESKIPLMDDILRMPIRVVDAEGRVVRVIPPGR